MPTYSILQPHVLKGETGQQMWSQGGVDGDPQASDIHACKTHRSADVSGCEVRLTSVAWHVSLDDGQVC